MPDITMNLHFCNKNWGADIQDMIDSITDLFDAVTVYATAA